MNGCVNLLIHYSYVLADKCLMYENGSALKKESTNWVEGRDTWWQVESQKGILVLFSVIISINTEVDKLFACISNLVSCKPS